MIHKKIKFIWQELGLSWYLKHRWMQFLRLMTNTSVLPSIILGFLAIYVSIYLAKENQFTSVSLLFYICSFCAMTLIICVWLGRYFFTNQTPEMYAKYSIEGLHPSDGIKYISYCIWKECEFLLEKDIIEKYHQLRNVGGNPSKWQMNKEQLPLVQDLSKRLNSRYDEIMQIDYMIVSLAKELNLPAQRLSDYLFQFSPEIYQLELRKVLRYMEEILHILNNPHMKPRRDHLTQNIINFRHSISNRRSYQLSIIRNDDLHEILLGLGSGFGLTNAIEAYCMGYQQILISMDNSKDPKEQNSCVERLKFLYHKRRLYPGFDLHAVLVNFTEARMKKLAKIKNPTDSETEEKELLPDMKKQLLNIANMKVGELHSLYGEISPSLIPLKAVLTRHIHNQRSEINRHFVNYIRSEIENARMTDIHPEKIVFISQGYSSTVNASLYKLADEIVRNQDIKVLFDSIDIYYYILKAPKELDSEHHTTSRYVRYKFKAYPNIPVLTEGKIMVKIGDDDWLVKRFGKRLESLNFIVSGAEFYQIGQKNGETMYRIINNEGVTDINETILSSLSPKHVVLAEDFKQFPRPLPDNDIRRVAFSQDHLEYIHLYNWSPKMRIINGAGLVTPSNNVYDDHAD